MVERKPYTPPDVETFAITDEMKGRGVFHDTYKVKKENGEEAKVVFKDFRLDVLFTKKGATDMFSKQEEEYDMLRQYFGENMLPKSVYIVNEDMAPEFEKAKIDTHKIYSYPKFIQIQLNRRLAGRYGFDERHQDQEQKFISKAFKAIGKPMKKLWAEKRRKEFVGAVIQENILGISFGKLFQQPDWKQQPNYETLRTNVQKLITGLRELHNNEEHLAYTWHSFDSDNIMVETDNKGNVTGRVTIIDTNFLQRPDTKFKKTVVQKLEQNILKPLEKAFDL